jgi:protein phosphatase
MLLIESAGLTDIGRKRQRNEDALLVDDNLKLYVVADGMGGHRAGNVASKLVVDTLSDFMRHPTGDDSEPPSNETDTTLSSEANRLLSGIQLSNRAVHDLAKSNDEYQGMGSTVSLLYFNQQTLIAANVGDSPIYLIHKDHIEQISVPHTVKAEHAAIDPEGAERLGHQFKHILTRAIGSNATVDASVCEIQYFNDDVLVLCSDGLSDRVTPQEILETVKHAESCAAVCRSLVDLANDRGGHDNITVIVLKVRLEGWNV